MSNRPTNSSSARNSRISLSGGTAPGRGIAAPRFHRVALDRRVGRLAAHALLGQGQQDALREHQPAQRHRGWPSCVGIDHELLDHAGHAVERKVERAGGIGRDIALGRGVRDVALVPQGDVLQRRQTAPRTTRARPVTFSVSTGLRLCGIDELPFWPSEKNSSASRTSVRCRWRISVAGSRPTRRSRPAPRRTRRAGRAG